MPKIFISYRRADSEIITGRIYDRLVAVFGDEAIFKDVDDIPIGVDFRTVLHQAVEEADVVLIVIGPAWANIAYEDGSPRLHDENDFVRIEVENALRSEGMIVVPVLVKGASMPSPNELPESIRALAYRNAISIRNDPDFSGDMQRLIARMEGIRRRKRAESGGKRGGMAQIAGIAIGVIIALIAVIGGGIALFGNQAAADDPTEVIVTETPTTEAPTTQAPTTVAPPTDTPTRTPTPTNTNPAETQIPYLEIGVELNVRGGPSTQYDVLDQLNPGDIAIILAANSSGTWYYVRYDDGQGWVSGYSGFSDLQGDTSFVRIATAPPTPTATNTPTVTRTPTATPTLYRIVTLPPLITRAPLQLATPLYVPILSSATPTP